MPIVSFWNNSSKETGQTLASVAVATTMAIDHNRRILEISTGFKDKTVEECFWSNSKPKSGISSMLGGRQPGMNNGIEGLAKVLQSNRTSSNVVSDYAKVVFRDRLDVLPSPETNILDMYNQITPYYAQLAEIANKEYNMVIIDIDKRMKQEDKKAILKKSDLIVVTLKQGLTSLDELIELKQKDPIFKQNNIILLVGKYDKFSKYNLKNITRYLRENKEISAISYNTLFSEAATEGKVADFFLKFRGIEDQTDRNIVFMQQAKITCDNIIFKLQELQLR